MSPILFVPCINVYTESTWDNDIPDKLYEVNIELLT